MAERTLFTVNSPNPKLRILAGHFAIGAGGAVSTTATVAAGLDPGARATGAAITKTATEDGRYTLTFQKTWKTMLAVTCNMEGPDDAAFPTTTGSDPQIRAASTSLAYIQCKRPDTQADTDPASGSVIHWIAVVAD